MTPLLIVALICLLLGLLSLAACARGVRRHRWLTGARHGFNALLTLAVGLGAIGVATHLYSYEQLTAEQPVAELSFVRTGTDQYEVRLDRPDGGSTVLPLAGDEWQLDARVLKWHGLARLLGFAPRYRLERLSGRWRDLERERNGPRTVHDLAGASGIDLWALARSHGDWLPWVDALYGSATYLPMADGARYAVSLGAGGLVARPLDGAAEEALQRWR